MRVVASESKDALASQRIFKERDAAGQRTPFSVYHLKCWAMAISVILARRTEVEWSKSGAGLGGVRRSVFGDQTREPTAAASPPRAAVISGSLREKVVSSRE